MGNLKKNRKDNLMNLIGLLLLETYNLLLLHDIICALVLER